MDGQRSGSRGIVTGFPSGGSPETEGDVKVSGVVRRVRGFAVGKRTSVLLLSVLGALAMIFLVHPLSARAQSAAVDMKVNFQSESAAVPTGYLRDSGESYGARTGAGQGSGLTYGWVREDSLDQTDHTPLSLAGNGRERNKVADQRLDTFIHMQIPSNVKAGEHTPGAWEATVPNGVYDVTVAVGDAGGYTDSVHQVNIENQNAIASFSPAATGDGRFATATRTVVVNDGRLTVDARGGTNTKLDYVDISSDSVAGNRPYVTTATPGNLATGTPLTSGVVADLNLPNGAVDGSTLDSTTVTLTRVSDGVKISAHVSTSGGGDTINIAPDAALDPNATYRFDVTSGVKDINGDAFLPFSSVFTTGGGNSGGGINFEQVASGASGKMFTSVTKGPDGKLYAATLDGYIYRWTINADGTLANQQVIDTVRQHATQAGLAGAPNRTIIGLAFDPASTASNPILWITDDYEFVGVYNVPDWSGVLARLTGPNLDNYQEVLTNLPRSVKDHETNSIAFGPDGNLYFTQGAMNAMGAPDSTWGNRPEHELSAAVLRLDPSKLPSSLPLDIKTPDGGGGYDPFAPGAPLTIYASGVRNAFDLVWASNGHLYAPTNGSAAGGNTPSTPSPLPDSCKSRIDEGTNGDYTGPSVPALTNNPQAETDWVYDVKQGRYYGHPNPSRCEWTLDNGNPTSGSDPFQVDAYPAGTRPDRNYDLADVYDAGLHASADGAVQYRGSAFGGALNGKLLVVRYSEGQDIETFDVAGGGGLSNRTVGITGFTGFTQPLDITEDNSTGYLYVTELGGQKITLLRPQGSVTSAPKIDASPNRLVTNDVADANPGTPRTVTVKNTGNKDLHINGLTIAGDNPDQFQISSQPRLPATIAPGSSMDVQLVFNPTSAGPKGAVLQIQSDDPGATETDVTLRGLGTLGLGGSKEPSLQWILDTYQIPVNVGDPDPTNNTMPSTSSPIGDEVTANAFTKADPDTPVSVTPIAVFGPQGPSENPSVATVGAYDAGSPTTRLQDIFTVPNASYQTLNPQETNVQDFDPSGTFGFQWTWPGLGHTTYQDDSLNTWESDSSARHKVRVYPLKDQGGQVVRDAYVVAPEDTSAPNVDYQDTVLIVRNVKPAAPAVTLGNGKIKLQNLDNAPYDDRLVSSRIQTPQDGTKLKPDGTCCIAANVVHDTDTVRVTNTGTDPLKITGLPITGPWQLVNGPALPANVPAGGQLDLKVRFAAQNASTTDGLYEGTLDIQSDASNGPDTTVQLGGFWQSVSEGGQEPSVQQIGKVFGYGTTILGPGEKLNQHGLIQAVGDEVLSSYWQRANTNKPVDVKQLAAYHTQGNPATFYWTNKGQTGGTSVFTSAGADGQTLLPHKAGSSAALAQATFTPSVSTFGFRVDSEYSDPALVNRSKDYSNGCPRPAAGQPETCGHHVRFWPARDRAGAIIPNAWIMAMDYAGINYDYNDNAYLISNIKPEDPRLNLSAPAPLPGAPSLALDFDKDYPGTLVDNNGQTTGFTSTQPNKLDLTPGSNSYRKDLLNVDTSGQGTLAITTTTGSNATTDNTQVNALQDAFDATSDKFTVGARLLGPLDNLNSGSRQGGVMFGADQNDFVKLVAFNNNGVPSIQFYRELNGAGSTVQTVKIPSPASVQSLDLMLIGDPATSTVRAAYRINGGSLVTLPAGVTLGASQAGRFFDRHGEGGIITTSKGTTPITVTFDRFSITPGDPTAAPDQRRALYRLDVGGSGDYTDTAGNVWKPDTGYFTPSSAIVEGANVQPQEISNTDDDVLFRTYRGNVGNVPLSQRVLTYNLPVQGTQKVDLRLYFAERYPGDNAPGKRVFDIESNGNVLKNNFDIYAASGGLNTAIILPINNVPLTNGNLNLTFRAEADNPSIAAIEVLCGDACSTGSGGTPLAAPSDLTASASSNGVSLDWAGKEQSNLAGYNVYRASGQDRSYSELTGSPIQNSRYDDTSAPTGATSYYRVTAVGTSGNESAPATVSATMPGAATPPTVTSKSPANNSTSVEPTTRIEAVFSKSMDAGTISGSTLTLTRQGSTTPVSSTVGYDAGSKRATLTPDARLAGGTSYTARIKGGASGVKDRDGTPLSQDDSWSFEVAEPPADTTPPDPPTIDMAAASDTGSSNTDNVTSDSTPTFVGAAEAGSAVRLYDDSKRLGEVQAGSKGRWTYTSGKLADGTHAVAATATDAAGYTSKTSDTLKVIVDTRAPVDRAPVAALIPGSRLTTSTVPVRLSWAATDGISGVVSYQLQYSAGGSYAGLKLSSPAARTVVRQLIPGRLYSFRVRARDRAGNVGAWATSRARVAAVQETSPAVHYSRSGWKRQALRSAYGGSLKYASRRGAAVRFTFTGKRIAWIAPRAYNRGKAVVWLDGRRVAIVDLYSASAKARLMVFTKAVPPSRSHTLVVRALGTKAPASRGTRVDVDAFLVLR